MKKSQEQTLLEQMNAAKVGVEPVRENLRFKIHISPLTTTGVDVRLIALSFRDQISAIIQNFDFASPISGMVFIPRIMDPEIAKSPDKLRYDKTQKLFSVGLNTPFSDWVESEKWAQIQLFAENLKESLRRVPDKHLFPDDRLKLMSVIDQVSKAEKAKSMH